MNVFDKNPNPFPIHVFSPDLQQVIQRAHAETQAPLSLIASSLLCAMNLSCQDLYEVSPKENMVFALCLFMIILAESGERKSTVDRLLMSAIGELEAEWEIEFQVQISNYRTDLSIWEFQYQALRKKLQQDTKKGEDPEKTIKALIHCSNAKPKEPVRKRVVINDITPAAIKKELGTGWRSLGLNSDEAGSILSGELLSDTPLLNSLWNGSSIEIDRANAESFKIEDARLSLMLMIQPKLFNAYMTKNGEQARASGFYARTLFCEPFSTIGQRTSYQEEWLINNSDPAALDVFGKRVKELLQKSAWRRVTGQPRDIIRFSPEASARWFTELNRVELQCAPSGLLENFRDYASKHVEHVARIAGLLEGFTTGNGFVSDQTMFAAIEIANWYFNSFIHVMNKSCVPDEIKHAEVLAEWLNRNVNGSTNWIVQKNYVRKFGPNSLRSIKLLNKAFDVLQQQGKVNLFKNARGVSFVQYFPFSPIAPINWSPMFR